LCGQPCSGYIKVISVPLELNEDHNVVLKLAEDKLSSTFGSVSTAQLMKHEGWDKQRSFRALSLLVREGMAWIDDQAPDGKRLYWFPSICLALEETAQDSTHPPAAPQ
jgi:ESCRT-II complex subunit VPS22